jgi:membrane protein implicated in regulation of membrane protease activity
MRRITSISISVLFLLGLAAVCIAFGELVSRVFSPWAVTIGTLLFWGIIFIQFIRRWETKKKN